MSSPREREKRDRRESRGDEREGQGRKRNRNEKGSGDMEQTKKCYRRTDGWTDGRTDRQTKAISIIPHLLRGGGLII